MSLDKNNINIESFVTQMGATRVDAGLYQCKVPEGYSFLENDVVDWADMDRKSFWYRHRAEIFTSVAKRFAQDDLFLEIGCGNGSVSVRLQEEGFNVIGIEPDLQSVRNARARGLRHIIHGDPNELQPTTDALGMLGIFDVLEHVQDEYSFLKKAGTFLRNDGLLLCAVPCHNILWSAEDDIAGHVRRYTCTSLAKVCQRAGFQVLYSTYYFSFLLPAIFMLRSLPYRVGLRNSRTADATQREHTLPSSPVGAGLSSILAWEQKRIRYGRKIPFGASCLLVGQKKPFLADDQLPKN